MIFKKRNDKNSDFAAIELSKHLGISLVAAKLLVNRSIADPVEAERFLNPSLSHLGDPFLFLDMAKAVQRIHKAISTNEKITIYGDYDVDGITAAAILFLYLKEINADVQVYLPNRHTEGYGLNRDAIATIGENGTKLLITVDCGIVAYEEVEFANSLGLDVIITDHHISARQKPSAYAVIATSDESCGYSFKDLCGAGLAAKLVQALGGINTLEKILDLAAIGTIADMVPLIGENRVLAAKGLEKLSTNPRIGIDALITVSGFDKKDIDTTKISFGLAPRLNAAGRMALAELGFNLLVSDDKDNALEIALQLNESNAIRQRVEEQLIQEVKSKVVNEMNLSQDKIIIVEGESWHKGVIGIAASKVVEAFNRPCLLISVHDGMGIGSARSIANFDIFEALSSASHLFNKLGGHTKAAGFALEEKNVPLLKESLKEYANQYITDEMISKRAVYDEPLRLTEISPQLMAEIKKLSPFGIGNPLPLFFFEDVGMEDGRNIGNDLRHVKFSFKADQKVWDGIGFGLAQELGGLTGSGSVDVLASIETNEWMGVSRIQLMVKSLRRVLSNKLDAENTLKTFYCKYSDVFLSSVGYNTEVGYQKPEDKELVSGGGHRKQENERITINLEDVVVQLNNSCIGHLFLVNSLDGARWLFDRLIRHNIAEVLRVNYVEPVELSAGAVVLVPDCSKIHFRHYKKIYIIEGEEHLCPEWFFGAEISDRMRVIETNEAAIQIRESYGEHLKVDRDFLENFYKWLKQKKIGSLVWKDLHSLTDSYNSFEASSANDFQTSLALEIFRELGFISVYAEHKCVKIEVLKNPIKRNLEDSSIYVKYTNLIKKLNYRVSEGAF